MIRASLFVFLVAALWGQVSPEAALGAGSTGLAGALIAWLAQGEKARGRA